jgi:hypothetical protein
MYLGRRIDILLNFGLARSSHGKIAQYHGNVIKYHGSSLIECYLGTVCEYVGVPRPMLDNSFARMFIHADWFKK